MCICLFFLKKLFYCVNKRGSFAEPSSDFHGTQGGTQLKKRRSIAMGN